MTANSPCVLLVEDDPVSRAFLVAAIRSLPASVDAADSVSAAIALVAANRYDLWLIDANLPDGSGANLLSRLRNRDALTPALAHTATGEDEVKRELLDAGFRQVLVKPLPASAVQHALRQALGLAPTATSESTPDWDDDAAARALNGNHEHIAALRKLFIAELPAVVERVHNAFRNEDFQGLHDELHRLRASCGFVGATKLLHAVQQLGADQRSDAFLQEFANASRGLLETPSAAHG